MKSRVRMSTLKNMLGDQTCHLEPMKGSVEHQEAYCTKELKLRPDNYFFRFGSHRLRGPAIEQTSSFC